MHCSKRHRYSIISSARSKNDSGIVSPSALAVLRLTTSSNLVGCSLPSYACAALGRHPGARLLRAGLFAAFFEKFGSLLCTQLVERLEHQTDLFSVFGFRVHLLKPIHQRGIFGT
jgi:hypothetical protein